MDWNAAELLTEGVCADVFDTIACRLQPRRKSVKSVNHHGSDDDEGRAAFDFQGSFDLSPPADRLTRHMPMDPGVPKGAVSYDAVLTAYAVNWPYKPQRDDHFIVSGVRWKIAADGPDGSARAVYYLVRA